MTFRQNRPIYRRIEDCRDRGLINIGLKAGFRQSPIETCLEVARANIAKKLELFTYHIYRLDCSETSTFDVLQEVTMEPHTEILPLRHLDGIGYESLRRFRTMPELYIGSAHI